MGRHRMPPFLPVRRRPPDSGVLASVVAAIALAAGMTAGAAAHPTEAPVVAGTPCTSSARACVDLATHQAWLIENGQVVRGPVAATDGAQGFETPLGTFRVEWKHIDHISGEYGTPMPYAVFFAPGGIAFHEGNLGTSSAGCVRLERDDAAAFFEFLQVGDEVQVR